MAVRGRPPVTAHVADRRAPPPAWPAVARPRRRHRPHNGRKLSPTSRLHPAPRLRPQVSGRNWGKAEVDGANLSFSVNGKTAFEVDCRDIGGVQQAAKTDVLVEFAMDDTATDERDALFEMSFHIPLTSTDFPPPAKPAKAAAAEGADGADGGADEEAPAPAKVLIDRLMEHAAASTGDPIATFHDVGVLTPRGNFTVEMHATFLRLTGQAADFKIQYSNLTRLFVLPRPNSPNMYAILTLDSAIRKGQTFYPHIVMQFRTDSQARADPLPPLPPPSRRASPAPAPSRPCLSSARAPASTPLSPYTPPHRWTSTPTPRPGSSPRPGRS